MYGIIPDSTDYSKSARAGSQDKSGAERFAAVMRATALDQAMGGGLERATRRRTKWSAAFRFQLMSRARQIDRLTAGSTGVDDGQYSGVRAGYRRREGDADRAGTAAGGNTVAAAGVADDLVVGVAGGRREVNCIGTTLLLVAVTLSVLGVPTVTAPNASGLGANVGAVSAPPLPFTATV